MNLKRVVACLLVLLLSPHVTVRADISSGVGTGTDIGSGVGTGISFGVGAGTGLGGTALSGGVDIWEDGDSFHVMYRGVERTLTASYSVKEYLVVSETYTDTDGAEVTVIYFNLSFISDSRWEEKSCCTATRRTRTASCITISGCTPPILTGRIPTVHTRIT